MAMVGWQAVDKYMRERVGMASGEFEPSADVQASQFNTGWFLKRLILGTAILVISFGSLAWLTHAAIDESAGSGETVIDAIGRLATQF
jgi:hypothetical protein